jgi:hypothetical protein
MKKFFIFVMSAVLLMTTGMVTAACSSDDDNVITTKTPESSETPEPSETSETARTSPQQPLEAGIVTVISDTGTMCYDASEDFWYVLTPLKVPEGEQLIDGGKAYYLYNLPDEYKVKGLKVKFTGVAYKFYEDKNGDGVAVYIGGMKYLDILVNQIEIVE